MEAILERGPVTILVADDDPINRRVLEYFFRRSGQTALFAEGGEGVVESFTRHSVDLILIDKQMPDLDGIEATRQIRNYERCHPERKPCYIVALTASVYPGSKEECLAAGMNEFLTKPIPLKDIASLIDRVCHGPS